MKKYVLFLLLFIYASVNAFSQKISLKELFSETYPLQANDKLICSEQTGTTTIFASMRPTKVVSSLPEQAAGPVKLVALNYANYPALKFEVNILGNLFPFDLLLTSQQNYFLAGAFTDSLVIDNNNKFYTEPGIVAGFVIFFGGNGQTLWVKTFKSDTKNNLITSIAESKTNLNPYITVLKDDLSSEVWQINVNNGSTLTTKIFPEVRTLSSIKELNGSLYIAGTAGDFALVDTFVLSNNLNTGYVNFIAKLDASLAAKWVSSRPYFTTDYSNHLCVQPNGNKIAWGNYCLVTQNSLRQNVDVFNEQGQLIGKSSYTPSGVLNEFNNRLVAPSIYPSRFNFARRISKDFYIYTFDPSRGVDSTRIIRNSEFQMYDFTGTSNSNIVGTYSSDSLRTSTFTMRNRYFAQAGSQNVIMHLSEPFVGVEQESAPIYTFYPNPTEGILQVDVEALINLKVMSFTGQVLIQNSSSNTLDLSELPAGIYLVEIQNTRGVYREQVIKK